MFNIPSQNLISHTRFDLIIKFLFAKSVLSGHKTKFYRDMYKHHLKIWNSFKEYNNPDKNTYEKFEKAFLDLIKNIGDVGFDKDISTIPVINKKTIERLWIKFELFFLKTPKINKNIMANEIKISGEIKSKLFIIFVPLAYTYLS